MPRPASTGLTGRSEESDTDTSQNNNNNINNNGNGGAGSGPVLVSNRKYPFQSSALSSLRSSLETYSSLCPSASETPLQERTCRTFRRRRWSQNNPTEDTDVQSEPEHHHRVPEAAVLRRDSGRVVRNWSRIRVESHAAAPLQLQQPGQHARQCHVSPPNSY